MNFFHNLSWQALTSDYDAIQIKFEAVTELVKSINFLIQKNIYNSKKNSMKVNKEITNVLKSKEFETIKTDNEKIEDKVVDDISNNDKTDCKPRWSQPTVRTDEEIDQDRLN